MTATTRQPEPPRWRHRTRLASLLLTGVVVLLGGLGCKRNPPAAAPSSASPGTVDLKIGDRTFRLEIAASDVKRQVGLMHRASLPEDAGMVFIFRQEIMLKFWMKNTSIPLDILYLDNAGRVVSISPLVPFEEEGVSSQSPARYAIELNRGMAAKAGVKVGDVLALPLSVTNPPDLE